MKDDDGWIRTLMEEAENERMHLMTFIAVAQPTWFERLVIQLAQAVFYIGFFGLYLISSRTAHRVVGYFEEEAVISYTLYLKEIDEGRSPNVPAPDIAIHYWKLPADATLRDVVLMVRADEAHHRGRQPRLRQHAERNGDRSASRRPLSAARQRNSHARVKYSEGCE